MGNESNEPRQILLADDETEVRSMLRLVLELDRHTVMEACDGQEALDLFKSRPFDVVVTDFVMPGMPGDQLAVEIKRHSPGVPVIMITANADLLPHPVPGVDLLLPKPFKVDALREAIRRVAAAGNLA